MTQLQANVDHSEVVKRGVIEAVKVVMPFATDRTQRDQFVGSFAQQEMGVLIGITGSLRGRLVMDAPMAVFSSIASTLFGMGLEGEMLESFVGELGNMVGGNFCTQTVAKGVRLDISPPTVLVGQTKLGGFHAATGITFDVAEAGELRVLLILEEENQD